MQAWLGLVRLRHSLHLRLVHGCAMVLIGPGLMLAKGINGLTARDIKLFVDGGYHTVEAVAYTYVVPGKLM